MSTDGSASIARLQRRDLARLVLAVAVDLHHLAVAVLLGVHEPGLDGAADAEVERQLEHVGAGRARAPRRSSSRRAVVDHDDVAARRLRAHASARRRRRSPPRCRRGSRRGIFAWADMGRVEARNAAPLSPTGEPRRRCGLPGPGARRRVPTASGYAPSRDLRPMRTRRPWCPPVASSRALAIFLPPLLREREVVDSTPVPPPLFQRRRLGCCRERPRSASRDVTLGPTARSSAFRIAGLPAPGRALQVTAPGPGYRARAATTVVRAAGPLDVPITPPARELRGRVCVDLCANRGPSRSSARSSVARVRAR